MMRSFSLFILIISACILVVRSPAVSEELPDFVKPMSSLEAPKDMILVSGGCFQMGDIFEKGKPEEGPAHEVCVDDFYIDKYEVTRKYYELVTGQKTHSHKGSEMDHPVEFMSWDTANEFCRLEGKRLPTEAEWEYAARSGGLKQRWAGTNRFGELGDYAWYPANSEVRSHPVGKKKPNELGIYDMNGNVKEWVYDWYGEFYYMKSPKKNPTGPRTGRIRILRGGSYGTPRTRFDNTSRELNQDYDGRTNTNGFRCAKTP